MGLEVGESKKAYNYFLKTSCIDLLNIMKNTDEGIHGAAAGGAWKIVVNGFAGMDVRNGVLTFKPWLPKKWRELSYTTFWHGNRMKIKISHHDIELTLVETKEKSRQVNIQGRLITLYPGKPATIRLKNK
jgi:kojibiose phosphorylase